MADDRRSAVAVRVLVVEDFEPFRQLIRSMLGKMADSQIVGEVSDGLEAVREAEELQPDLILLDIGLPSLNGIEAARRIRRLAPEAKIFFVTQEFSADVVQTAFTAGAAGYVVKMRIHSDLLLAVEAVRQGRQFVSPGLSCHNCSVEMDAPVSRFSVRAGLRSVNTDRKNVSRNHQAHFYADDASFLSGFRRFIESALDDGVPVIVVATEAHRTSLYQRLQARGRNVNADIEQGRYIPLDVADTLATFMVNDMPDPALFLKAASDLVLSAAKASKERTSPHCSLWRMCPSLMGSRQSRSGDPPRTPVGRGRADTRPGYFVRVQDERAYAGTGQADIPRESARNTQQFVLVDPHLSHGSRRKLRPPVKQQTLSSALAVSSIQRLAW